MTERRVVVTGTGLVTPFGIGTEKFWDAVSSGLSGISKIREFDPSHLKCQIAGACHQFDPSSFLNRNDFRRMDRVSQFAVVAASLAVIESRLPTNESRLPTNNHDTGVIIGTGLGGITTDDAQHALLHTKGPRFVMPTAIPMIMYNAAASHISNRFGFKGPGYTITTACASGTQAIGEAYRLIKHGYADAMIAGGADAPLSFGIFSGWCALRVLSTRNNDPTSACRPFSGDRDGMVLAEGAGIVVLEELRSALRRSANIQGEIAGYGSSNDAHHIIQPTAEGEAIAIRNVLNDALLSTEDIDYINAHGTGTITNDIVETEAIKNVFKKRAYSIPISSTKSMIGHAMGAAGAIEFITCVLALKHDLVPPTINYSATDPQCDLDYVSNVSRNKTINIAISNSFAFGGTNAVLAVKKFQ
jgi:3-oxoacyl-[acyl-carrier-protein] synthase II